MRAMAASRAVFGYFSVAALFACDGGASTSSARDGAIVAHSASSGLGAPDSGGGSSSGESTSQGASGESASASSASTSVGVSSGSSGSSASLGIDAGWVPGSIQFEQCLPGGGCGAGSFVFSASFDFFEPCSKTTSGGCTLYQCAMIITSGYEAGTLKIAGGSIPAGTLVTDTTGDGTYYAALEGTVFSPGQALTVWGSGAAVPMFGPEVVLAPSRIMLTEPQLSDAGSAVVATSSDLHVSWSGGQVGAMVTLTMGGEQPLTSIACSWDASIDHGVVPQALLSQLGSSGQGYLEYGQQATTSFVSGPYSIAESALLYSSVTIGLE